MSENRRGARAWAAGAALGCLLTVPHSIGVAAADSTDGVTAPDARETSRPARVGPRSSADPTESSTLTRAARQSARGIRQAADRDTPAPAPAASRRARAAAIVTQATVAPARPVTPIQEARAVLRTQFAPTVPAPAAAVAPPAAAVVAAPVVSAQAVATRAVATPAVMTALRTAVAKLVDRGLNWANALPSNPIADFLSGALLLIRRELGGVAATAPPAAVVGNVQVVNTYVVSTLSDSGAGSLRQAILDANAAPGADEITFSVAGVIRVGNTALPTITDATVINGASAPGYSTAPVVRIDFQNTAGLTVGAGASGSQIIGLSLVDASDAGVTLGASSTVLSGNYIGVWGNGRRVEANRGDGVVVLAGSLLNVIGIGSTESFALSNVISGNRGNGITIYGNDNIVQANYIGTDPTGSRRIANGGNGIHITAGAAENLVGGLASGGNAPTADPPVIATPPQGNLISGNRANGVLIDDGATRNQLSGNFIGTDAGGDRALGNRQDGVAIVDADYNKLIGTTSEQQPFIYYNVVSGNRGNGLRVTNADHTVVHANFFGIGADNSTAVGNRLDGMLVNGDSQSVDSGGEIPLGNVMAGNRGNGMAVAGTAGGVVSFNNFVGYAAFGEAVANRKNGILVTSSNPGWDPNDEDTWNRIRTSLIGGNRGNGIEFAGNAYGAEVTETAIGTDSSIRGAIPNGGSGIVVGGNSSHIAIGGFQPSVEEAGSNFSVYSSGNRGYGIVFKDNAHDSYVFDTRVGLGGGAEIFTAAKLPNGRDGILLTRGTSNIQIGGQRDALNPGLRFFNEIVGNKGNGVTVRSADGIKLLGNTIALNKGSGLVLNGAQNTVVGAPLAGNFIIDNRWAGVFANGILDSTTVQSSTITGNGTNGVRLASARGITVGGAGPLGVNLIGNNDAWGILASGFSWRSLLKPNIIVNNDRGAVSKWAAIGLQVVGEDQTPQYTVTPDVDGAGGGTLPVNGWQGLTTAGSPGRYLMSGTTESGETVGLLYVGPITTQGGAGYVMVMPDQPGETTDSTTTYSADYLGGDQLRIVGSFSNTGTANELGWVFTGSLADISNPDNYTELPFPTETASWNVPHSTSGGLVVGNYNSSTFEDKPAGGGRAYVYDAVNEVYLVPSMVYPGSGSNTLYGIWWNGGTSYTLCGGYSNLPVNNLLNPNIPLENALMVDFDSSTNTFSNWKTFKYSNPVTGYSAITHFEGISGVEDGKYTLAGVALDEGATVAGFVTVYRNADGSFGDMIWTDLKPTNSDGTPVDGTAFADSVYGNAVVGIAPGDSGVNAYTATIGTS